MSDEMMTARLLMAAVRKAGGRLELTVDEYGASGNCSIEFDPPASDDGPPVERIIVTVDGGEVAAEKHLWWASLTEYPDEGYLPIEAATKEEALAAAREHLAGDDPETPISIVRMSVDDIQVMQATADEQAAERHQLLKALTGLVTEIEALIAESHGVAGLHLNGDVATWDELEPGGRFERLASLADARAAIAAATGKGS